MVQFHPAQMEVFMLCNQCCSHISRELGVLEGKTVNLMAYGCSSPDKCDHRLRERFDRYVHEQIEKIQNEKQRNYYGLEQKVKQR
jgi:hypothetical protein